MAEGKILVVDDEKVIRDLFTRVLGKEGYEVFTTKDGEEGLKKFKEEKIDLALIDIKMPRINGMDVLKEVKKINPDCEVIIITGYASLESAIEAVRAGAYDYIQKPFERIGDVVNIINKAIEKQRLLLENRRLQEETEKQRDELKKRAFELGVLYDVSNATGYTLDYKELLRLIMNSLSKVIDYDLAASFLFTTAGGEFILRPNHAMTKGFMKQVTDNVIQTITSLTDQPIDKDIRIDVEEMPLSGRGKKLLDKVNSYFNVPLIVKDKAIGMLNVSSSRENAFGPDQIKLLYTLSNQAAGAIQKLRGIIAAEKSKMDTMVESMGEGVIMTDERGELVVINPTARKMLGFKLDEEVTSRKLVAAFRDTGKGKLLAKAIGLAAEEEEEEEELRTEITLSGAGGPKVLHASQALVKGEEGKKLGYVTALRDITKEKEVDRMKTEFISTVSHELRTPLTSMKNVVSNILAGVTGEVSEKLKGYLSMMDRNIDRLSRLIGGLLDISRIESGRIELKKSLIDIDALAKKVISSLKSQIDEKKLKVKIKSPSDLGDVYVDPDRITEVFTNLLGNATKFTSEGGSVTVAIEDKDEEVHCSVTDTGIGIPEDELGKVFGKFHQVGRVDGPGAKGTGLGLAITKELVGMHKGHIWAESKLGKGSKFTFTLPKADIETIFREYLNYGVAEAKRLGTHMSLMVVALANFEQMKEEYKTKGILKVLKEIGVVVNETISGPVNSINRYHRGEVTAVLLETERRELLVLEKKLKKAIKTHQFTLDGKPIKVGVSFGIAIYPEEAQTEDELIKKVEASLGERKTYKPRIMVVDDEVEFCKALKIIMEDSNYGVVTCNNGQEALKKLTGGYSPDLIVLDLLRPVMDGYEFYMLVKENKETQDIPILVLTGKGQRADERLGIKFAARNSHMTKPFEHKELLAKIDEMLEQ